MTLLKMLSSGGPRVLGNHSPGKICILNLRRQFNVVRHWATYAAFVLLSMLNSSSVSWGSAKRILVVWCTAQLFATWGAFSLRHLSDVRPSIRTNAKLTGHSGHSENEDWLTRALRHAWIGPIGRRISKHELYFVA